MSHKATILRNYRELLDLIHCLPAAKRSAALAEARIKIREGATEVHAAKQSDLLKELVGKISYLRAATPRNAWRRRSLEQPTHYVFRGGKLVQGYGQAETRWAGHQRFRRLQLATVCFIAPVRKQGNMACSCRLGDGKLSMDEGYRKHRELLKRQYFGREPPSKSAPF